MTGNSHGPLTGLKVVDLTHHLAGPTCGLMLADLGAEVIKVEKIPGGDDSRRSVPPHIGDESAAFMMMNRNKRGIALDLKSDGGKTILRRLAADADVLIENFRPGTLDRLGVGYDTLKEGNPRLIYGVISGFGLTGPYRGRGGFDLVAQGMSGLMSITGDASGSTPTKVGAPVTDITAGLLLTMGVLAALHERERTGEGQVVDTSLFEAGITHTYWQSAIAFATGVAPLAMGSRHPLNAPYQAFRTADSWMCIGAASQRNWQRLMDLLEAPDIADDPRFADNVGRMANTDALDEKLTAIFRTATTERVARPLRGGGHSRRAHLRRHGHACRSADRGPQHDTRGGASYGRQDEDARPASEVLAHTRQRAVTGAPLWPAHARGSRPARILGGGDRRVPRGRRHGGHRRPGRAGARGRAGVSL